MSKAFLPYSTPHSIEAQRILERAEQSLRVHGMLFGFMPEQLVAAVLLARQLDEIAQAAAALDPALRQPSKELDPDDAKIAERLGVLLFAAGYLPIPEQQSGGSGA